MHKRLIVLFLFVFLGAFALAGKRAAHTQEPGKLLQKADLKTMLGEMRVQSIKDVEVPPFTLKTHDGKDFRIADHRGKVLLLNFWTTF